MRDILNRGMENSPLLPLSYEFAGLTKTSNSSYIDSVLVCIFAIPNQTIADLVRQSSISNKNQARTQNIRTELMAITGPMRWGEPKKKKRKKGKKAKKAKARTIAKFRAAIKESGARPPPTGDAQNFLRYLFDLYEIKTVCKVNKRVIGVGTEGQTEVIQEITTDGEVIIDIDALSVGDYTPEATVSSSPSAGTWRNTYTNIIERHSVQESPFIVFCINRENENGHNRKKRVLVPETMTLHNKDILHLTAIVVCDDRDHYVAKFKRAGNWFHYDSSSPDLNDIGTYDDMLRSRPNPITHGSMYFYMLP